MFCRYCGKELGPKVLVCSNCGMPVNIFGSQDSQMPQQNMQTRSQQQVQPKPQQWQQPQFQSRPQPQTWPQQQPQQPQSQPQPSPFVVPGNQYGTRPGAHAPQSHPAQQGASFQQNTPIQQSTPVQQGTPIRQNDPVQSGMPMQRGGGAPAGTMPPMKPRAKAKNRNPYANAPYEQPYEQMDDQYEGQGPEESDVWFPPKKEKQGMPRAVKITLVIVLDLLLAGLIVFFVFFWNKDKDPKETRSTRQTTISGQTDNSSETDVDPTGEGDDGSGTTTTEATSSETSETTPEPSSEPTGEPMLTSNDQITKSLLENLKQYSENLYQKQEVKTYPDNVKLQQTNYLGYYFVTAKDKNDSGAFEGQNAIFVVYQMVLEQSSGANKKAQQYFWYCGFPDIKADGTVDTSKHVLPKASVDFDKQFKLKGYSSVDRIYNALITKYAKKYETCEKNVDESKIVPLPREENDTGMIFPESDTKKINTKLIPGLSHEELRAAINEIWARHGYIFRNESVLTYYRQFSWYKEKIPADEWDRYGQAKYLNSVEMENIDELTKERDKRKANGTYPY